MTGLFVSRKVSAEKKKDADLENRQRHGSENLGYIPEELWNTEQIPSESKLVNHVLSNCISTWAFWTTCQAITLQDFTILCEGLVLGLNLFRTC